jgi:hypothetical protein
LPKKTWTRSAKTWPTEGRGLRLLVYCLAGVLWILFCLALGLLVAGCTTLIPKEAKPKVASFDGLEQNSGFIGFSPAGWGIITPAARDRYNALAGRFGNRFLPPLCAATNGGLPPGVVGTSSNAFLIDPEHLAKFIKLTAWQRSDSP